MKYFFSFLIIFIFLSAKTDIEVGLVNWNRGYSNALKKSKKTKKSIFALFQEVPGCDGCQKFGKEVLSKPLMVEAIENLFFPLLIYNNKNIKEDQQLLKKYQEPAWNYQVVRFWDAQGRDIIPRRDRIWEISILAQRMIQTLQNTGKFIPEYLISLTYHNLNQTTIKKVALQMSCFWTGEYYLGRFNGVVQTEAGFIDGKEVVLIWYLPRQISLTGLVQKASEVKCADKVLIFNSQQQRELKIHLPFALRSLSNYSKARESDQKKQLEGTVWNKLTLNNYQKTKINSWAPVNSTKALAFLSPKQMSLFFQKKK